MQKGKYIMTITKMKLKFRKRPTLAERREIRKAYKMPMVEDEDAPAYAYEELVEMKKAADERRALEREEQRKQTITIRLDPETVEQAKKVGKGYTGFLARLIENALKDKDLVAKSL